MSDTFNQAQFAVRIKSFRTSRGMSILKLAKETGINKNILCAIEKGTHNTSIKMAYEIASALEVQPQNLLNPDPLAEIDYFHSERVQKGARKARKNINSSPTHRIGDIDVHLNGGNILAGIVEVFSEGQQEMHDHDGEELFFCLTGKILVQIGGKDVVLEKGDCVLFWGAMPHNYLSVREDDPEKISVGLSVISGSKHESLVSLNKEMQKGN